MPTAVACTVPGSQTDSRDAGRGAVLTVALGRKERLGGGEDPKTGCRHRVLNTVRLTLPFGVTDDRGCLARLTPPLGPKTAPRWHSRVRRRHAVASARVTHTHTHGRETRVPRRETPARGGERLHRPWEMVLRGPYPLCLHNMET